MTRPAVIKSVQPKPKKATTKPRRARCLLFRANGVIITPTEIGHRESRALGSALPNTPRRFSGCTSLRLLAAVSVARNLNRCSDCPTAVATWSSTHFRLASDSATLQRGGVRFRARYQNSRRPDAVLESVCPAPTTRKREGRRTIERQGKNEGEGNGIQEQDLDQCLLNSFEELIPRAKQLGFWCGSCFVGSPSGCSFSSRRGANPKLPIVAQRSREALHLRFDFPLGTQENFRLGFALQLYLQNCCQTRRGRVDGEASHSQGQSQEANHSKLATALILESAVESTRHVWVGVTSFRR